MKTDSSSRLNPENPKSNNWKILHDLDFFGVPVHLHVNEKEMFKTPVGGAFTILTVIFTVLSGINLISQMLQHTNANLSTQIKKDFSDELLNLNEQNFKMAIRLGERNVSNINEYFTISMSLVYGEEDTKGLTEISTLDSFLSKCPSNYFQGTINSISFSSIDSFSCLQGHSFDLFEKISNPQSQKFKIMVMRCQNNTLNNFKCASKDKIDAYFASNYHERLTILFENHYTVPSDPENYIRSNIEKLEYSISKLNGHTKTQISINKIEVYSDFNLVTKEYSQTGALTFEKQENLYSGDLSEGFATITLIKGSGSLVYFRTYSKLIDVLSFMGGVGKSLAIIFAAVAIPYNKFKYNVEIANQVYEFDHHVRRSLNTKKNRRRTSEKNFNMLSSPKFRDERAKSSLQQGSNNICAHMVENQKINMYHPFFKSLIANSMSFTLQLKEIIWSALCCQKENIELKWNLYNQARKRIKQDVDIITVLKKLQDVDKLKQLLLNKNQRAIFNYKRPLKIRYQDQLFAFNNILEQTGLRTRGRGRSNGSEPSSNLNRLNSAITNGGKSIEEEQLKDEREGKFSMFIPDLRYDSVHQFIDLFHSYREIKKNPDSLNKKLINSLGNKVKTIFEMVDEDMQREINSLLISKSLVNLPSREIQSSSDSSDSSSENESPSANGQTSKDDAEKRESIYQTRASIYKERASIFKEKYGSRSSSSLIELVGPLTNRTFQTNSVEEPHPNVTIDLSKIPENRIEEGNEHENNEHESSSPKLKLEELEINITESPRDTKETERRLFSDGIEQAGNETS